MGLKGGHVFTLGLDCEASPRTRSSDESEGQGFRTATQVLDNRRIEVAAQCLGLARGDNGDRIACAKDR